MRKFGFPEPAFAPPGEGEGDAEGDGGEGAGEGGGQGEGAGGGEGGGSELYRPEGLPESYHGENDRETIDRLFGAVKGFRDEKAKLPPVPKDIGEYGYEPSDALKPYLGGDGKDPLMESFKAAAFKHKIPASVFSQMIEDTFAPLVEKGDIPSPYNPEAEAKKIGEYLGAAEGERKEAAASAWEDAKGWAKGLSAQLGDDLNPEAKAQMTAELGALAETAGGVMVIRHLKSMLAEKGLSAGGEAGGTGGMTKADLKRLDGDERIDPNSDKFDPDLRQKYDEGYKRHHP